MLVDHHSHLQHEKFKEEREKVIKRSCDEMAYVVISGANDVWNREAIALVNKCPNFYATLGYHPVDAIKYKDDEWERKIKELKKMAKSKKVIGIGEVGLDYHWLKEEKDLKKAEERFIHQIELANELKLPLIIHSRDAEKDAIEIVKKYKNDDKVVFHCYSTHKYVELLKEYNFRAAACTNIVRSKSVKKFVKKMPLELIFTETDAPYLSPNPGKINYPWNVAIVVRKIAELKGIEEEEVKKQIKENFENLYGVNR